MDTNAISINGYYLRPTLGYKASTIFGGDDSLRQSMSNALGVLGALDPADKDLAGGGVFADAAAPSFADLLRAGVASVNGLQLDAEDLSTRFAAGLTDNIHEVLIAGEKADIALQLATAIRSKVLDAYNEIMRMQL